MLFFPVRGKNFVLRGWKLLLPTSFVQTTLSTMQTATTAEEIARLIGISHADGRDFPPVQAEVLAPASRKKHVVILCLQAWRRRGTAQNEGDPKAIQNGRRVTFFVCSHQAHICKINGYPLENKEDNRYFYGKYLLYLRYETKR